MKSRNIKTLSVDYSNLLSESMVLFVDLKSQVTGFNSAALRLSGYASHDLLGKTEKYLIHHDSPKSVFMVIKENLAAGRICASYQKNITKDGNIFWVFNIFSPTQNGYLSIGIKPRSSFFSQLVSIYDEMGQIEKSLDGSPEKANKYFLGKIKDLGFASYELFQFEIIKEEIEIRNSIIKKVQGTSRSEKHEIPLVFSEISELISRRNILLEKSNQLSIFAKELELVAINSTVRASFLGRTGAPLSIIGKEISLMSQIIGREVESFSNTSALLVEDLNNSYLSFIFSEMENESLFLFDNESVFESENSLDAGSLALYEQLQKTKQQNFNFSMKKLKKVFDSMTKFEITIESLNKVFQVLQFSYVAGCAEMARISEEGDFKPLFDNLKSISDVGKVELNDIDNALGTIRVLISNSLKAEEDFKLSKLALS